MPRYKGLRSFSTIPTKMNGADLESLLVRAYVVWYKHSNSFAVTSQLQVPFLLLESVEKNTQRKIELIQSKIEVMLLEFLALIKQPEHFKCDLPEFTKKGAA
jgi:hypothetical protein